MATTAQQRAEIAEGFENGADDFLAKPVNGEELRARTAYEKPTTERKRRKAAAVKRYQKKLMRGSGLMSAMPVGGVPSMPFQQQRGPEAWAVVQQLRADYEVREVPMTTDKIDSDITVTPGTAI